ncbi:HD-GYP domain-containing protein [Desulfobaculum sp. SPO524]|uniref:HD-GYP domain-containing protein n=1 Tax=Desulfobaculum sp. SPO524 TaxID=3378071 RepID=UPI003854A2CF
MSTTCRMSVCPRHSASASGTGTCGLATCRELSLTGHQLAEALGNAVDAKDHSTHFHSEEVAEISRILALHLGMNEDEAETIHIAGHLHDIGKIGIPDAVLRKPGPLTDDEWNIIQQHPRMGADIVRPIAALAPQNGIAGMILHHHERLDGSGYPHGLSGQAIPIGARIIAVADSLSAMLQPRPYCRPKTFSQAYADVLRLAGTKYDPEVVNALTRGKDIIAATFPAMRRAAGLPTTAAPAQPCRAPQRPQPLELIS